MFRAVSEEVPFAVIPQENSTYGVVVDTYDTLRDPEAGQSIFVRGELTLAVKHCLVVRSGVKLENIQRVMSHEQVRPCCNRMSRVWTDDWIGSRTMLAFPVREAARCNTDEGPVNIHRSKCCPLLRRRHRRARERCDLLRTLCHPVRRPRGSFSRHTE